MIKMNWDMGLILTFFICSTVTFVQHDYIVNINYVKLDFYERSVFQSADIKYLKLNRTFKAFTICATILVDFENEDLYKANIKAYKIITNVPMKTPIFQTDVKISDFTKRNLFGFTDLLKRGNVTAFPFKKGTYCLKNFHLDSNRLPPFIPSGEYKSQLSLLYDKTLLATVSGYGNVIYKMKTGHD